nr:conotoxin precursor U [Conus ebraeus]
MGFFLTLTVAVLLTSLICTEAVPTDEGEVERHFNLAVLGGCRFCVIWCCPPRGVCQSSGCRPAYEALQTGQ